jgi:hypothetical protein
VNAVDVLERAKAAGIELTVIGDRVKLRAPGRPPVDLLEAMRQHKAELLALLTERERQTEIEAAESIGEHLAERAAIMEFDGGLPREQAEVEARRISNVYRFRLHGNEGGGTYITSGDLEAARAALLQRYGSRLVAVVQG